MNRAGVVPRAQAFAVGVSYLRLTPVVLPIIAAAQAAAQSWREEAPAFRDVRWAVPGALPDEPLGPRSLSRCRRGGVLRDQVAAHIEGGATGLTEARVSITHPETKADRRPALQGVGGLRPIRARPGHLRQRFRWSVQYRETASGAVSAGSNPAGGTGQSNKFEHSDNLGPLGHQACDLRQCSALPDLAPDTRPGSRHQPGNGLLSRVQC
jgi:hypothetical protein